MTFIRSFPQRIFRLVVFAQIYKFRCHENWFIHRHKGSEIGGSQLCRWATFNGGGCLHYYNHTQLPPLLQSHKGRWWYLGLRAWDCCTACKYNIFNSMSSIWEICRCWKCFSVEAIECPIHVIVVNFEQQQLELFCRFDLNSILFSTFMVVTIGNENSLWSSLKSPDFILSQLCKQHSKFTKIFRLHFESDDLLALAASCAHSRIVQIFALSCKMRS